MSKQVIVHDLQSEPTEGILTGMTAALQFSSLIEEISRISTRTPNSIALLAPGKNPTSYAQVVAQINSTLLDLAKYGITGDTRVAISLNDTDELGILMIGVMSIAVAVPLNPRLTPSELQSSFSSIKPRILITTADSTAAHIAAEAGIPVVQIVVDPDSRAGRYTLKFPELLEQRSNAVTLRNRHDTSLIIPTSGTTGQSKLVPLTQAGLLYTMRSNINELKFTQDDRLLGVMPLYHIHGLGALLCMLLSGGSAVITAGFNPDLFLQQLIDHQITWYTAVPTIHQSMLQTAETKSGSQLAKIIRDSNKIRIVRSGSAPMPKGIPEKLEALFNATYIEAGGATETSAYFCTNRPGNRTFGSIGQPVPGTTVAIRDDAGNLVGPGIPGEIVIKGPGVFSGYINNPVANAESFVDGFFRSGDLGHYDVNGFFYITGRIKEQINRGGMKISPVEVDEAISAHPSVQSAATFALPDIMLGQEVAIAVIVKQGATLTELELQRFASERLADYKVPRAIYFTKTIPTGGTGKILRRKLTEQYSQPQIESKRTWKGPPTTPIEQALASIWSQVLGREIRNIEAPFFSLGGDSLQALNVCLMIEKRFNRTIPLAAMTAHPTIHSMAKVLSDDGWKPEPGAPIVLRDGEPEGKTLFVLPGVGGNIYSYHAFVRHFSDNVRVIGFPLPGADGLEAPIPSIEKLADRFIEQIRKLQPTGPYALCGYSFGGRLVLEIAHRLRTAGEQVPVAAVFDTFAPDWPPPLNAAQRTKLHLKKLLEQGPTGIIKKIKKKLARKKSSKGSEKSLMIQGMLENSQLDQEKNAIVLAYASAGNDWTPPKITGPIQVFRATDNAFFHGSDLSEPTLGWCEYVSGEIKVEYIKGNHMTILHEPHVTEFAKTFSVLLK